MTERVECHSGCTYAERPTALTWQGKRHLIAEIHSQGRTPLAKWFRVRTAEGLSFELSWVETANESPSEQAWKIKPF